MCGSVIDTGRGVSRGADERLKTRVLRVEQDVPSDDIRLTARLTPGWFGPRLTLIDQFSLRLTLINGSV